MLFIVQGEWIEVGALVTPDQVQGLLTSSVLPSLEILAKWEEDGTMVAGGVYPGERTGVFVLQVESAEEVGRLLTSLPFWGQMKWHVRPLQTFRSTVHRERALLDQIGELVAF